MALAPGESMLGGYIILAIVGFGDAAMLYGIVRLTKGTRRLRERLARMKATLTSTIALAPLNEIVELTGTVMPLDESQLVPAAISGTPCVWWRVEVCEESSSSIITLKKETGACDFLLDDASGEVALVRMKDASVGLSSRGPAYQEARARLFLEKYEVKTTTEPDKLLWFEEVIEPKKDVYVLGHARPVAEADRKKGPFRGGRQERFVIEKPPDAELVVSVGHEALLATKLQKELENDVFGIRLLLGGITVVTLIFVGVLYEVLRELGHI